MPHMVVFRSSDGSPGYHQAESLEDAVRKVEHLRNEEQVTETRIFRMEEVPIEFKPYYRVEIPGSESAAAPAAAAAPAPAPAAPAAPEAAAPAPAPEGEELPPFTVNQDDPLADIPFETPKPVASGRFFGRS